MLALLDNVIRQICVRLAQRYKSALLDRDAKAMVNRTLRLSGSAMLER
ncbi:hypothetical protein FHT85_001448 [Rhizobium sp. BK312]|nr:hypothetical protein [Rhizobium sp. BK312]MBB3424474.1 hypothetical protein [Rhizobium sp. BK312]